MLSTIFFILFNILLSIHIHTRGEKFFWGTYTPKPLISAAYADNVGTRDIRADICHDVGRQKQCKNNDRHCQPTMTGRVARGLKCRVTCDSVALL